MTKSITLFLFLFVGTFITGCVSSSLTERAQNLRLLPAEVISTVNSIDKEIVSLHAEGTLSLQSPSFANSASFAMTIHKPDSLMIDITGPFGIHIASMLYARPRYVFVNHFSNEFADGEMSVDNMPPFLNLPIVPEEIVARLSGARYFNDSETFPDSFYTEDGKYILVFTNGRGWMRYGVNGKTLRIEEASLFESGPVLIAEEKYEYRTEQNGRVMLQSMQMSHEKMQSAFSLYYDTIEVNPPRSPLSLLIPDDAVQMKSRRSK